MVFYAVDDEPLLLEALKDTLAEAVPEAEVYGFTHATPVLDAMDTGTPCPDVAFLDVELPGMGGLELAKQIKQRAPKAWVIFVTGFTKYAVDAYAQHAEGYLVKPVTVEKVRGRADAADAHAAVRRAEATHEGADLRKF